jgi:hypothetical protein
MNINHFMEGLTWVWVICGILLLPLNSFVGTFFICLWLKIKPETWLERVMTPSWILQILWNLVFFSIGLLCSTALENDKGKITYTLTRNQISLDSNVWDFHFYRETDKGKTEIDTYSEEATPFQKAYVGLASGSEGGLDPKGLHDVEYSDGSVLKVEEEGTAGKRIAFNALSEAEARTYIDHYNIPHPVNYFFSGLLPMIVGAVIFPFLWMLGEAFVIAFIAFCFANPILAATIYGPIAIGILNTLGIFSAIGSAFAPRRS